TAGPVMFPRIRADESGLSSLLPPDVFQAVSVPEYTGGLRLLFRYPPSTLPAQHRPEPAYAHHNIPYTVSIYAKACRFFLRRLLPEGARFLPLPLSQMFLHRSLPSVLYADTWNIYSSARASASRRPDAAVCPLPTAQLWYFRVLRFWPA